MGASGKNVENYGYNLSQKNIANVIQTTFVYSQDVQVDAQGEVSIDSLNEAAEEIKQILQDLDQLYPPANTVAEKMVIATEVVKIIEEKPPLKRRLINAAKAGGLAAIEKAFDNRVGIFLVGAIKDWQEVE